MDNILTSDPTIDIQGDQDFETFKKTMLEEHVRSAKEDMKMLDTMLTEFPQVIPAEDYQKIKEKILEYDQTLNLF